MFKVLWLVLVMICWLSPQVGRLVHFGNGFHLVDLFHPIYGCFIFVLLWVSYGYHHILCEAQDEFWTSACSSKFSEERPQKKSEENTHCFSVVLCDQSSL